MRAYYIAFFVALVSCLGSSLNGLGDSCLAGPSGIPDDDATSYNECLEHAGFCGICGCQTIPTTYDGCGDDGAAQCCLENPGGSCLDQARNDVSDASYDSPDTLEALDAAQE
jgi:hypothetical protein